MNNYKFAEAAKRELNYYTCQRCHYPGSLRIPFIVRSCDHEFTHKRRATIAK